MMSFRLVVILFIVFFSLNLIGQTIVNKYSPCGGYYLSDTSIKFNQKEQGAKKGWWKYFYFPTRINRLEFYENDKINGKVLEFYSDGATKSICRYKDGKRNGYCIKYKDLRKEAGTNKVSDRPFERFEYKNDTLIRKLQLQGHQAM